VKINIEGNALYRQPELVKMRDISQEDEAEREAAEHDLSYVSLDGNIACMVNGAGLAMATMDIIKLYGGEPANFLDVGGGATSERVKDVGVQVPVVVRLEGTNVDKGRELLKDSGLDIITARDLADAAEKAVAAAA
jgi:succinyl-CoA synthetase beta subunit